MVFKKGDSDIGDLRILVETAPPGLKIDFEFWRHRALLAKLFILDDIFLADYFNSPPQPFSVAGNS